MIWQNPWAWMGLAALAVPVLVHLLSRHRARLLQFPTLRFLDVAAVTPTRRTRLNDLLVLAVRLAVLAAAVAGLAQPLLSGAHRAGAARNSIVRAIIVDTSASMLRPTPSGIRAVDAARSEAQRLAREAATSVVLETGVPARAIAGASEWLHAQTGTRGLVIVSDFQKGAIDKEDLAPVSDDVGVQLHRIDVSPAAGAVEWRAGNGESEMLTRLTLLPDRTDVDWTVHTVASGQAAAGAVILLSGVNERAPANAARRAALAADIVEVSDTNHAAAIVYPEFERREAVIASAAPLDQPWMADAVARVRSDAMLATASAAASVGNAREPALEGTAFVVVARTDSGRPVVMATRAIVDGRARLVFFSLADAGSLASAALLSATARALAPPPAAGELEPGVVAESELRTWERLASAAGSPLRAESNASDGRWLWLLALVLLGVEAWLRSRTDAPRSIELTNERVA